MRAGRELASEVGARRGAGEHGRSYRESKRAGSVHSELCGRQRRVQGAPNKGTSNFPPLALCVVDWHGSAWANWLQATIG